MDITRQEFYDKYKDAELKFLNYYKYTFTFTGFTVDGVRVVVGYGGNSDEIYRYELDADSIIGIESLQPYSGTAYKDGRKIYSFYDY